MDASASTPLAEGQGQAQWIDVLASLREACALLRGPEHAAKPMLHTPEFSLHEAMSAVELFDPKMDPCCALDGPADVRSILCQDVSFSMSDVLAVARRLLVLETAYADGASILESTHQCVYLWPDSWPGLLADHSLPHRALHAHCRQSAKMIATIHRCILDSDVAQDEDFQHVSKPSLETGVRDDDVFAGVAAVIEELRTVAPSSPPAYAAMLNVLLFRQKLHEFVCSYAQLNSFTLRQLAASEVQAEGAYTAALTQAKSRVDALLHTAAELLLLFPSLEEAVQADQDTAETHKAFSLNLVRLVQTSPLRQVPLLSAPACAAHLRSVVTQVSHVLGILGQCYASVGTLTYEYLAHLVMDVSARHYHLLARSLLQALLHALKPVLAALLVNSMVARGVPSAAVAMPLTRSWAEQQLAHVAWASLNAFCVHRYSVVYRLECQFPKWAVVAREAAQLDLLFQSERGMSAEVFQCHVYWTMLMTSLLMDAIMCIQVELDLVSYLEMDYFFWYADYICTSRLASVQHLREHKYNEELLAYESNVALRNLSIGEGKKKKNKNAVKPTDAAPKPPQVTQEEHLVRGRGQLCRGVFRMAVVAAELGYVSKAEIENTSWSKRFTQRFRAFEDLSSPPPLPFTDYANMVNIAINILELLSAAAVCFKKAKAHFDDAKKTAETFPHEPLLMDSLTALCKVCVAANVGIMRITAAEKEIKASPSAFKLSIERAYHPAVPVIELRKL